MRETCYEGADSSNPGNIQAKSFTSYLVFIFPQGLTTAHVNTTPVVVTKI